MKRVRPALLISIHDVSPLTLAASRSLVGLMLELGVPLSALTVLVVPQHENGGTLDENPATCRWLRELADAGASLCLHGLTHQMTGVARSPWQWLWARVFARGQGELYLSDETDCKRRLDAARTIIRRCGLADAVQGFVPPAWLLSPAARRVVRGAGFAFYELLSGIRVGDAVLARRLIGFGSLNVFESRITAAHAWLQSHRGTVDTRLAIHPADWERRTTLDAIGGTLGRLLPRTLPMNYAEFLRRQREARPGRVA
jgi:predicted deacetylase